MSDWRDLVGLIAIVGGSLGLATCLLGLWWVSRQPLEQRLGRHFMRRRANGERRHHDTFPRQLHWYVRSGFDRRHGGGRRQGH